jgi:hypothetical protein
VRWKEFEEGQPVEDRLVPINTLLGLLLPNDINPPALASAGFQLAGLEIPAGGAEGTVVIDVLLFHAETNHLVQAEAKSGANAEDAQAVRYSTLRVADVVRSAYITLPARTPPTSETVYLCLAEHHYRVRLGLEKLGLSYPIMKISQGAVALDHADTATPQFAQAFADDPVPLAGPPPRLIPFDQDSDVEIVKPHVLAVLVEAMSHRLTELTLHSLAERATPHYGIYGRRAQGQIRKKIADAARRAAAPSDRTLRTFPRTTPVNGLVKILRTPEDNDPRGRTQAYQAVGRESITPRRRKTRPEIPSQLDLLAELYVGDNDGSGAPDAAEQEGEL